MGSPNGLPSPRLETDRVEEGRSSHSGRVPRERRQQRSQRPHYSHAGRQETIRGLPKYTRRPRQVAWSKNPVTPNRLLQTHESRMLAIFGNFGAKAVINGMRLHLRRC